MRPNVLVIGGGHSYYEPFSHFGRYTDDEELLRSSPSSISLAILTGGADVSPELYNQRNHHSYPNPPRDAYEVANFNIAYKAGIPVVGICRGAQLLCVLAGGSLVQHLDGHSSSHDVVTADSHRFQVSSLHHQIAYPWDIPENEWELLAWSDEPIAKAYEYDGVRVLASADTQMNIEPDVIYYHTRKALAAQFHPEFMSAKAPARTWLNAVMDKYMVPHMVERGHHLSRSA